MFLIEFCKSFKNTYIVEYLWRAASKISISLCKQKKLFLPRQEKKTNQKDFVNESFFVESF